jgi:hypothetical protein
MTVLCYAFLGMLVLRHMMRVLPATSLSCWFSTSVYFISLLLQRPDNIRGKAAPRNTGAEATSTDGNQSQQLLCQTKNTAEEIDH